jgi:major membrane immunogen (membrane-anchored lipoprotein)
VDTLSGATHSGGNFHKLSAAVIQQAKKGDSSIFIVPDETTE